MPWGGGEVRECLDQGIGTGGVLKKHDIEKGVGIGSVDMIDTHLCTTHNDCYKNKQRNSFY